MWAAGPCTQSTRGPATGPTLPPPAGAHQSLAQMTQPKKGLARMIHVPFRRLSVTFRSLSGLFRRPDVRHHPAPFRVLYHTSSMPRSCTACRDLSTGDAIRIYSGHHKACVTCALNGEPWLGWCRAAAAAAFGVGAAASPASAAAAAAAAAATGATRACGCGLSAVISFWLS